MKISYFKNIANIILITLILGLSYLETNAIIKDSNGLLLISIIDVLVIVLLIINLFVRKTVVKEVEVVKEVFVNEDNIDSSEVFEIIDDKTEIKKTGISLMDKDEKVDSYIEKQLINISKQVDIAQAVFYLKNDMNEYEPKSTYAYYSEEKPKNIKEGDGIIGQAIKDKKMLSIDDIPDGYITILSGLGKGNPKSLLIIPAVIDNKVIAVAEFASLNLFTDENKNYINESVNEIAKNIINVH